MNANKTVVIYHGNCADGFGAAWVFWKMYGEEATYHAGVYQDPPPECVKDACVFLVDFSYKRPVMEQLIKDARSVVLIDHHKSALADLKDLPGLYQHVSLEKSGAMLAWDYLYRDQEPPALLKHIQDRDLWKFALANTREIQAALFSYEYDFELWNGLMTKTDLSGLAQEGAAIERKHHKDLKELLKVCYRRVIIAGVDVPVANLPYTFSSDAGNLMAIGQPFAACYWDTLDARCFSLRSDENGLDVSEIAKKFGGGGHVHAAGFKVPRDHYLAKF